MGVVSNASCIPNAEGTTLLEPKELNDICAND
jgi:hypothetical protein